MAKILGVILAAGRGSRMKGLTDKKPKCLLTLAGKTLLDWQLQSLRKAGVENILVVCGYQSHLLQGNYDTIKNSRWDETNMVQSLLAAYTKIHESTILLSYADIVYHHSHVEQLIQCKHDLCLTYDTQWQELWELRAENTSNDIFADAESFQEQNGILKAIGQRVTQLEDIQGQYMGLLKISPQGIELIKNTVENISNEEADKLDMTALLNLLLQKNVEIHTIPVNGAWCECDTKDDIEKYENKLRENIQNKWTHDWR